MSLDVKNVEKHGASRSLILRPYCASLKPVNSKSGGVFVVVVFLFHGYRTLLWPEWLEYAPLHCLVHIALEKKSVSFYIISISPNVHVLALLKKKIDSVYVSRFKDFIWITLKDINDLLIEFIDAMPFQVCWKCETKNEYFCNILYLSRFTICRFLTS